MTKLYLKYNFLIFKERSGKRMSVYKSKRREAAAKFIAKAGEIRALTMKFVMRLPKYYWKLVSERLVSIASSIFANCIKGNSIYMHKNMFEIDYKFRRQCFVKAYSLADVYAAELTFAYTAVREYGGGSIKSIQRERAFKRMAKASKTSTIWDGYYTTLRLMAQ